MTRRALLLLCGLILACAESRAQETPAITGYVTRAASNSDFDVNGWRIRCNDKTLFRLNTVIQGAKVFSAFPQDAPFVGEILAVYGSRSKKLHAIDAIRIEEQPLLLTEVSGSAIIDAPPA